MGGVGGARWFSCEIWFGFFCVFLFFFCVFFSWRVSLVSLAVPEGCAAAVSTVSRIRWGIVLGGRGRRLISSIDSPAEYADIMPYV